MCASGWAPRRRTGASRGRNSAPCKEGNFALPFLFVASPFFAPHHFTLCKVFRGLSAWRQRVFLAFSTVKPGTPPYPSLMASWFRFRHYFLRKSIFIKGGHCSVHSEPSYLLKKVLKREINLLTSKREMVLTRNRAGFTDPFYCKLCTIRFKSLITRFPSSCHNILFKNFV